MATADCRVIIVEIRRTHFGRAVSGGISLPRHKSRNGQRSGMPRRWPRSRAEEGATLEQAARPPGQVSTMAADDAGAAILGRRRHFTRARWLQTEFQLRGQISAYRGSQLFHFLRHAHDRPRFLISSRRPALAATQPINITTPVEYQHAHIVILFTAYSRGTAARGRRLKIL